MGWGPSMLAGAACALCLTIAAGGARAGDLEEGIRLYDDLDFEGAAAKLESAIAGGDAERRDVARAALYLGLARFQLGDPGDARVYFSLALAYDEELGLPEGTSPKIREVYDEVAARFDFPRPFAKAGEQAAAPAPTPAEPPPGPAPRDPAPAPSGEDGGRLWTFATAGATLAAGGTAVAFALLAQSTRNTIEREPHERAELEDLQDQLDRRATTANVLFAVTGTLAVSTAIVFLAEGKSAGDRAEPPAVAAGAGEGSAWVSARFSF